VWSPVFGPVVCHVISLRTGAYAGARSSRKQLTDAGHGTRGLGPNCSGCYQGADTSCGARSGRRASQGMTGNSREGVSNDFVQIIEFPKGKLRRDVQVEKELEQATRR